MSYRLSELRGTGIVNSFGLVRLSSHLYVASGRECYRASGASP